MAGAAPFSAIPPVAGDLRGGVAWVLSDGKAGHEAQSFGIARELGLEPVTKRVSPRGPFALLAPFGPIDPREAALVAPPFPDIVIACGRRTIPYLRRVKRASGGRVFTIYVNAPATGPKTADVVVAPLHDGLAGANVVAPLTPANRLTRALLEQTRAHPDPRIAALSSPRVALLVGGDSRHYRFSERDTEGLAAIARSLADEGWSVMATVSRRTPPKLAAALRATLDRSQTFLWSGEGPNPYLSMLACANAIIVTADSVNMISEAAATGAPVHVFEPGGGHRKIAAFIDALEARGAVRRWNGRLEHWSYAPLNSTPMIAEAIAKTYADFRAELAAGGGSRLRRGP